MITTSTYISLGIILVGILYIIRLSYLLRASNNNDNELENETAKGSLSNTTDDTDDSSLLQDTCFNSPHDAIALLDSTGLLIHCNNRFKKQFPEPPDLNQRQPGIYDFFSEKLWLMLQKGLTQCQIRKQKVQQEFSVDGKHFLFTFVPSNKDIENRIFLFCKERSIPPTTRLHSAPNEDAWKCIVKLTHPAALHLNWQSRFKEILPDLCEAFDANEIFFLDKNCKFSDDKASYIYHSNLNSKHNHQWLLSVPVWMHMLSKGKTIHNYADNFEPQEQILLSQDGIKVLLLVPLILNNKFLALIGLCRCNEATLFEQQQINNLRFIANVLTMAICNQQDRFERDRLGTVVEQSNDCIIIINANGLILYANPACNKLTGFSPKELIGTPIKHLYAPSIRKDLWYELRDALSYGRPWSGQFINYRKDNTPYEEEMLLSPVLDREGKVANQVIVKRDITEDKRLESIAEAANLMDNIGFIFSSIRHELGNPINSIKVSLSVLQSNLATYETDDISRFIHRSLSDIGRVEYLLKTLRNFSIFERPDLQKTNMQALLDKLTQLAEKDLAKHNVTLTVHPPQEPLTGMIDPRAFLQVLLNLITNAVAALHGEENKIITISIMQNQKRQITFIFEDNGCGMDEDTARNLFRPFFTTKAEGTGLGLVIVKKMLSKMNCSITASSEKGKGTRMEIIIPTV